MAVVGIEDARIEPLDREAVGEQVVTAINRFRNRMEEEAWPGDPPESLETTRASLRPPPPHVEERRWLAWSPDGELIGQGVVSIRHTGENEHTAGFHLGVLPEWRRRGLARRLLEPITASAEEWSRRLLFTSTIATVPAGEAFMRRLGARLGQEERISQLDLTEQDPEAFRTLLREWKERVQERAAGFTLGVWEGPYPEEALEEVAQMRDAANLMPRGDLEYDDEHTTPERLRAWDERMVAQREERWSIHARDPETGRIAGYTEVFWHPDNPTLMWQGDTAVFKEYQQRGLGRWLKAVMMEKILAERPGVTRLRTGNATTNAPMLGINVLMGFRPYQVCGAWQLEVAKAREYLEGASEKVGDAPRPSAPRS